MNQLYEIGSIVRADRCWLRGEWAKVSYSRMYTPMVLENGRWRVGNVSDVEIEPDKLGLILARSGDGTIFQFETGKPSYICLFGEQTVFCWHWSLSVVEQDELQSKSGDV